MLPYLTVWGRTLPTYGLLGVAGVLLGMLVIVLLCKRFWLAREDCIYLYAFSAVGALVGAKLLYLVMMLPQMVQDFPLLWTQPAAFFGKYISGGLVFYGGLAGGVATAVLFCRAFRWRLGDFLPVLIPVFPLIHAVGRVGCFCAGCCYGIEVPWGIAFSNSIAAPNGVPLLPVQLIEAAAELCIFAALMACAVRGMHPWRLLAVYLLLYAPVRFTLEFFRGDAVRGHWGALSTSQWISLLALAAGVLLLVYLRRLPAQKRRYWRFSGEQTLREVMRETGCQLPGDPDEPLCALAQNRAPGTARRVYLEKAPLQMTATRHGAAWRVWVRRHAQRDAGCAREESCRT